MTPSLLLEEPPAQTSAKEPWVSGGPQSGLGVSSASLGVRGGGRAGLGFLSLPKQLVHFQMLPGVSCPLRASC